MILQTALMQPWDRVIGIGGMTIELRQLSEVREGSGGFLEECGVSVTTSARHANSMTQNKRDGNVQW